MREATNPDLAHLSTVDIVDEIAARGHAAEMAEQTGMDLGELRRWAATQDSKVER